MMYLLVVTLLLVGCYGRDRADRNEPTALPVAGTGGYYDIFRRYECDCSSTQFSWDMSETFYTPLGIQEVCATDRNDAERKALEIKGFADPLPENVVAGCECDNTKVLCWD